jgi:hypothetical protein
MRRRIAAVWPPASRIALFQYTVCVCRADSIHPPASGSGRHAAGSCNSQTRLTLFVDLAVAHPSRFCLGGESVSPVLLGSAVHRRCRWIIGGSVAALHRRKRESAALRQSATAESASRVLLLSMPVAMPNIKDQTLQSFLSCQLTVIVPDLAN